MQKEFPKKETRKQQAAIDFMVSYGIAMLVIGITIYVILQLGVFNPQIALSTCTPSAGFSCTSYATFRNGTAYFLMTQATGGQINITGSACSTASNTTNDRPKYGNINLLKYSANTLQYYPDNSLQNGLIVYSNTQFSLKSNCYGSSGISKGNLGSIFTGYLWINYTYSNLPNTIHYVTRIATVTTKYT
jgi:hypothetical protein